MYNKNEEDFEIENKNVSEGDSYYSVGVFIWEIVKVFFWALVIIIPIRVFLFQPFFVKGASMEPNFHDGEYLIVNEIGYKRTEVGLFTVDSFRNLQRGDVVIFRYPKDPSNFFIKRVIALPGEKIKIDNGKVIIYNNERPDGFYLDESDYLSSTFLTAGALEKQLGEDEYFVMGDNRGASNDSRSWGPIKKGDVVGRALLRAWPVSKIGVF